MDFLYFPNQDQLNLLKNKSPKIKINISRIYWIVIALDNGNPCKEPKSSHKKSIMQGTHHAMSQIHNCIVQTGVCFCLGQC